MKTSLQVATFIACCISPALALPEAVPETNSLLQFGSFTVEGETFHGEAGVMVNKRDTLETLKCTRCVGHHGLCTIGEGNCYAPDGCFFCGKCGPKTARCQNPKTGKCQCY
ncbi:hypothetical protein BDW42DRAFT_111915 [Aspergillus taichungensis]|uniref:Uncharacterized protein n=1 Tax=Aspergillus taichungensis TaxID=482145 RepID=A0A2J5HTH4_9EURO|nr:hypothetical protein BDW42DRAFT_111915 [Aspergillus taichungensis]